MLESTVEQSIHLDTELDSQKEIKVSSLTKQHSLPPVPGIPVIVKNFMPCSHPHLRGRPCQCVEEVPGRLDALSISTGNPAQEVQRETRVIRTMYGYVLLRNGPADLLEVTLKRPWIRFHPSHEVLEELTRDVIRDENEEERAIREC